MGKRGHSGLQGREKVGGKGIDRICFGKEKILYPQQNKKNRPKAVLSGLTTL